MKHIRIAVAAGVAAAALLALVGAGTASANTELCSTNTIPCSGTVYGEGTEVESTLKAGTEATLKAGFATVKCKKSKTAGKIEKFNEDENPEGKISSLTFEECNCTVTVLKNGSLAVEAEGTAGNGKLIGLGTETTINCSGVSCIFGTAAAGTELGTATGGNPATFTANASLPWQTGDSSNAVCTLGSGTGKWTAEYELTKPKPLFLIRPLELTPKKVKFTGLNNEKQVTIKNNTGVQLKEIEIVVDGGGYEATALCAGANINSGATCVEEVKCTTAGAASKLTVKSKNPIAGIKDVARLNC